VKALLADEEVAADVLEVAAYLTTVRAEMWSVVHCLRLQQDGRSM